MLCCARSCVARRPHRICRFWFLSRGAGFAKRSSPRFEAFEDEDTKYAGLVIHSVTHDARAMDVVEFFTRSESLRTIILPEPDGALCARAERLAKLSEVRVPRIWSRSELRRALSN